MSRKPRVNRKVGRPSLLTDEARIERFLDLLRAGNHATTAGAATSIGQSTLYGWLELAQEATAELHEAYALADAEGRPRPHPATVLSHHAVRCVEFSERFARARAEGEVAVVTTIHRVIHGGHLISRKPALTGEGMPIYDETGALVYEEVFAQPDGKLGLEVLSRSAPDRWGRMGPQQIELSGPGGGPVQVESATVVKALAERLGETLAIGSADADDPFAPVDAEIVEDERQSV